MVKPSCSQNQCKSSNVAASTATATGTAELPLLYAPEDAEHADARYLLEIENTIC